MARWYRPSNPNWSARSAEPRSETPAWLAGDVRPYGQPAAAAPRPHVRVAAAPALSRGGGVAGGGVNDGHFSEQADANVLGNQVPDRDRACGLLQELLLVDQRSIRV